MIGLIKGFVTTMFASSKAADTAIDGLRKLGGLDDMNGKEKAKFLIAGAYFVVHMFKR